MTSTHQTTNNASVTRYQRLLLMISNNSNNNTKQTTIMNTKIERNEVINIIGKGVTDPHIHIFNGKAYMYASHDYSNNNKHRFIMKDWVIYSSNDLLNWTHECTLKPENTYIGHPINGCWATDAVAYNSRYYWAFSQVESNVQQIGLVASDTPIGPWTDEIGHPLIPHSYVNDTAVYDPCFFKQGNDVYILFGCWNYYIVKMSHDMKSIDGIPQRIQINNVEGPYGKGKADDKVSLHQYDDVYYLSWGCYYATSTNLFGPYEYRGCIIKPSKMERRFRIHTWPHGVTQGRHGRFFEFNDKWYFAYCEMCFSNNRFYRDFWISPVHYEANGDIETIVINSDAINAKATMTTMWLWSIYTAAITLLKFLFLSMMNAIHYLQSKFQRT